MGRSPGVEIIARETIKPSSPTPNHLRNFKLSLLDQITPVEYAPILFFYTSNGDSDHPAQAKLITHRLKKSLSETLTKFYPFSGTIKNNASVDCNDNGIEFVEARANYHLSDILQKPDQKLVREFLPIEIESPKASIGPLLLVQATFFKCGGVAIGICFSHMVADGSSISTFIQSWTSAALESRQTVQPEYVTASVFPPEDSLEPYLERSRTGYVTKRFVFDASKLAALRAKVTSAIVPKPTGVEAVTALIWRCTTNVSRSLRGFPRPSLIMHAMNLRRMVVPALPDHTVGNIVGYFSAQTTARDMELQDLICRIRNGKEEFCKNGIQTILENKTLDLVAGVGSKKLEERDDIDLYFYSSLGRFPIYKADFGWGKPIWVTMPNYTYKNVIMLLGTKDGEGMEALVTLSEEDMSLFESDPELLAFASFNPSILQTVNGQC